MADSKQEIGVISSSAKDNATRACENNVLAAQMSALAVGDGTPGCKNLVAASAGDLGLALSSNGAGTPGCKNLVQNAPKAASAGDLGLASGGSSSVGNSHKLIFHGCCKMTDEELAKHYNVDQMTDEELLSVGLSRQDMLDSYRAMHEVSMLRAKPAHTWMKKPEEPKPKVEAKIDTKGEAKAKAEWPMRDHFYELYAFPLLNELVNYLSTDDYLYELFISHDMEPDYPSTCPQWRPLFGKEKQINRFVSYCQYLETLYLGPFARKLSTR